MSIRQAYQAYRAECARTDEGSHGAILREATPREQELYNAWRAALENCSTWHDEKTGTTWHILSRSTDVDLEMWTCRITTPDHPGGDIGTCYASFVREVAQPVDEESRPSE